MIYRWFEYETVIWFEYWFGVAVAVGLTMVTLLLSVGCLRLMRFYK